MSDQFFWFATRAAGIMTWFSATLSLCVGLMMSSRALGRRPTIPWLLDVHRYTAAMSVVFLFLHLFTLWADSFVEFSLADFVIPGRADVPGLTNLSVAWGVVAAWILLVVQGSSLVKKYLPPDWWHTIHLTSFGVVIAGLAHAMQSGSDADNRIIVAVATSLLTAIVLLLATRILRVLLDRKYQFDRANDAEGTAGLEVEAEDLSEPDHDLIEASADRRGWSRRASVAEVGPTSRVAAKGADIAELSDVDLDAYAYGDFSHLPSDNPGDQIAGDDSGRDRNGRTPPPPVSPVSPASPSEREQDAVPIDGGPPDFELNRSVTKRADRLPPPAVDEPERRWGGPGSFAKPLPEIEGRPRRSSNRPRTGDGGLDDEGSGDGEGPPPIRR